MMGGWGYGYNNMMNGGWLGGLLLLLFGALVVAGIVVLIVWTVRQSTGHSASGGPVPPSGVAGHDEAIAIAKRRLASGEITKEQYDEIMKVLG
jgi:uncharacterized membrane protein